MFNVSIYGFEHYSYVTFTFRLGTNKSIGKYAYSLKLRNLIFTYECRMSVLFKCSEALTFHLETIEREQ